MIKKKIISSVTNDLLTDQRVHRICSCLALQDYEVILVGRRKKKSKSLNQRLYSVKRFDLFFEKGPFFYAEYNLRLFLYLLFSKVDLLISNDLDTLPANYIVSRLRRIPIVYDSHEYFTEVPELIKRKSIRSIWLWIERRCIKGLNDYLTVSPSIADAYHKKYGIVMRVIRNLPLAYNRDEIKIDPENVLEKNGKKIILYQGSVNVERGLEEMMRAMEFLPDFRLLVCGDGDILQDLISMRSKMSWKDRIEFKGSIALERLPEYTVQADVGISIEKLTGMSYTYALPNKVFDYVQAGIPVLVSNMPEVVKLNKEFGFAREIQEVSVSEIVSGITELFKSNDHYLSVRKNTEKAAGVLNWSTEEAKLLLLFERILFPAR